MATIIQTHSLNVVKAQTAVSTIKTKVFSRFWATMETNRFGIIAMLLIVVGCLGGFAAAIAVQRSSFQLLAVTLSTMAVESLILSVMPMRSIIVASVISAIISLFVIIF